ncbi:MAG: signal peptidase II [Aquificaceae bacterium]|nr:signal peptidase II [Aquificaceae bacterium]MDW8423631.1 signal peptidase II [Aquificaceae bacterium]
MGRNLGKTTLIYTLVALAVLLLDLLTKNLADTYLKEKEISLLPFLHLVLVYNKGVAFGLLSEAPDFIRLPILLITPILALVITYVYAITSKGYSTAVYMGMVAGGAMGNFYDRAFLGYVRDFIYLSYGGISWPAFNLADASISTAVALLLFKGLFWRSGKR